MHREEAKKRLEGLVTDVALEHGWSQDAAWAFYSALAALSSPCACGGESLADVRVKAEEAGGHSGPTYRYLTYEVKVRFSITTNDYLPASLPVRAIILEDEPCS